MFAFAPRLAAGLGIRLRPLALCASYSAMATARCANADTVTGTGDRTPGVRSRQDANSVDRHARSSGDSARDDETARSTEAANRSIGIAPKTMPVPAAAAPPAARVEAQEGRISVGRTRGADAHVMDFNVRARSAVADVAFIANAA